eukprot:197992_1
MLSLRIARSIRVSCLKKLVGAAALPVICHQRRLFCSLLTSNIGLCAVTGGNGFLGSQIVKQLNQKGYKVRVLDIHDTVSDRIGNLNIEYSKCDITNIDQIYNSLNGVKTIFHCASLIDIRYSPSPLLHEINVNGTNNIITFCNDNSNNNNYVKHIIYTSTLDVLSIDRNGFKNAKENTNVYGRNYVYSGQYAKTKSLAEQIIIENKLKNEHIKTCAIRIPHMYGEEDELFVEIANMIKKTGPISLGNGEMSICYVGNAAFAHIQIAEALITNNNNEIDGEVFHYKDFDDEVGRFIAIELLGYSHDQIKYVPLFISMPIGILTDLKQYIYHKWFNKLIGHRAVNITKDVVNSHQCDQTMNTDKHAKVIGYKPPYSMEESVQITRNWVNYIINGQNK